ncbi:MAG: 3-oxoacyl-ACP reductase FabG [Armatimonadetes bacterium]|nr:3-oxoacyl-ACP reductase FabG [Armatimonadota bacterium]
MFRLDGRVALVTGASRGIGKGIALVLARAGADLALSARDTTMLRETAALVEAEGRRAAVVPADLRNVEDCRILVNRAVDALGRVDILVNNAGLGNTGPVETITVEKWDEILETNLRSAFLLSQAAVEVMGPQNWGRIINISSVAGHTGGVAGSVAYASSKGGMHTLTRTLARDLAPRGITVNAVAPGQIETDMGRVPPERLPGLLKMIPLGRLGVPEDIGYAVLYLASEEAAYVTGAVLDVNGGILRR